MPAVGVPADELEARVRQLAARPGGGRSYVGSTANPTWRWRGGKYWRSEADGREPAARPVTMVGHRCLWRRLVVLGSWRDSQAARMEVRAIQAARKAAGQRVTNVAHDARGLATRPHGYSFVYICLDEAEGTKDCMQPVRSARRPLMSLMLMGTASPNTTLDHGEVSSS